MNFSAFSAETSWRSLSSPRAPPPPLTLTGEAAPIPPYTLGSHASSVVQLLRRGHEDVELTPAEFIRLVTWVDANAPYYGSYYGRRNIKYREHPDFRPTPTMETVAR